MMPVRHCLGPEAPIHHMDSTSEEGSVIQGPFKNTSKAHREGQISLILPALSGFGFIFVPGGFSAHPKVLAGHPGE